MMEVYIFIEQSYGAITHLEVLDEKPTTPLTSWQLLYKANVNGGDSIRIKE